MEYELDLNLTNHCGACEEEEGTETNIDEDMDTDEDMEEEL